MPSTSRSPFWITSFIALVVYLLTLAPHITWANFGNDGGELITAAMTLGVPHPPGYSTYTLLGHLLKWIPLGPVAFRFNLFSAICMAAAAGVLSTQAFESTDRQPSRFAAIAAALSFAFASGVWRQAIITEVYALNLFVLSVLLLAIQRKASPFYIGLLWALSITTHLTSLLALPLVLWSLYRRRSFSFLPGLALGLTPLLALPLLAMGDSPVVWGDPTTLSDWWWLVSGRLYRPNVLAWPFIWPHLQESVGPFFQQLALIGWPTLVWGAWTIRQEPSREQQVGPLLHILIALAFAAYAISYDAYDYSVFALPALLFLTPILYRGLRLLGAVSVLLPVMLVLLNFNAVNLHGDYAIHSRVHRAFGDIPQNAIVITPGDQTLFSLWYFQHVEGLRPDTIIFDSNMFAFDWYRERLFAQNTTLAPVSDYDIALFRERNQPYRPICNLSIDPEIQLVCSDMP